MREPGIHISKTQFINLLSKFGVELKQSQVDKFFVEARGLSLSSRSLISKRASLVNKAEKRVSGNIRGANTLADIIYSTRISLKHNNVTRIKQKDPEWTQIKELMVKLEDFIQQYKFKNKREAYIEYVKTGFSLMKGRGYNSVLWLNSNYEYICNVYKSRRDLQDDSDPDGTREVYDIYSNLVLERVGIKEDYIKYPDKYICFLRAREMADSLGITYEAFIEAQFEFLEFCNGIPRIEDLYGDKAKQRLIKYLSKRNMNLHMVATTNNINWADFKK